MTKVHVKMSGGALDNTIYKSEKNINIQDKEKWEVITPKVDNKYYEKQREKLAKRKEKVSKKKHLKKKRKNKLYKNFSLRRLTKEYEKHIVYVYRKNKSVSYKHTRYGTIVKDYKGNEHILYDSEPRKLLDKVREKIKKFPTVTKIYVMNGETDIKKLAKEADESSEYKVITYYIKLLLNKE